ncbi:uncharacterized protein K489DRAFT_150138 [Dissoconium aciculare CBS 342.82]|jgi:hypothetical protein|uniref:Uncharacterized protein n=1 Tax=Dissoconium aciculare CBS 342.82 TaxID=1314786 RepID=A0A6J3MAW0_9PEZI|nr:uncharacterized protein K489DRAFT_150138 [Dissoconium aciculare CBS 342.82]KAF1825150.1 hypothetical protein K489DRAFT_150138 [Dissoconium aciculare CBS 342.82]
MDAFPVMSHSFHSSLSSFIVVILALTMIHETCLQHSHSRTGFLEGFIPALCSINQWNPRGFIPPSLPRLLTDVTWALAYDAAFTRPDAKRAFLAFDDQSRLIHVQYA